MGFFSKKSEERAEETVTEVSDALLRAYLSGDGVVKNDVLGIPSIASCVDIISNVIAALPVKLYKDADGKVSEVKNDRRTRLINDETGDTLKGFDFKKALITDYLVDKGGYAYIKKSGNEVVSLHYVDSDQVSIVSNQDPIFKDYDILVLANQYKPYEFLKILRNTKDGAQSSTIMSRNPNFLSVMINALNYEDTLVKTGGNKKGFLKTEYKLTQAVIDALKAQWRNLYTSNSENCVVLNKGLDFKESSASSVEMQMNENKETNAKEACKLFNMPPSILDGSASEQDKSNFITLCINPILDSFENSLNKDLLLEREKTGKEVYYFAIDRKELTKGDIEKRFNAYKTAIDSNFMQIDEVRYAEDLEPIGMNWIKLGLDSVLYNPKTNEIYTPNTNQTNVMGNAGLKQDLEGGEEGGN